MQNPSLDTAHFDIFKSSTSTMNDALEDCLTHTHNQPSTRISSASTLYDTLQDQNLVQSRDYFPHDVPQPIKLQSPDTESWDYLPYDPPSLSELQYPELPQSLESTHTKAGSWGWCPHKRRNTESDLRTQGLVRKEQHCLDGSVKRRRVRSASLNRGSAIYNTWTAELFQHDSAVLPEEYLLKTDPENITSLWEEVSMLSSRLPQPQRAASEKSAAPSDKAGKKPKAPSPYDNDFGNRVLEARSITINEGLHSMKAYKHFEVDQAVEERVRYYTTDRKAPNSPVWLNVEEPFVQDVAREYACMDRRTLCEAEFASYARETLLKRHSRVLDLDQGEHERVWIPERMIELVAKPKVIVWKCPPLVGKHAKAGDTPYTNYEFDLRPDCAYWLSLQAVNPEYRTQVQEHIFVVNKTITCPYLTIEFKKDDSAEQVAWNQVACAAAVALYNRFLLRQRMLEASKQDWDIQQHFGILRHYGMTFTGSCYKIWSIRPTVTKKGQWSGCRMDLLHQGDCVSPAGVRDLIDWINEIHCWGLTKHGPECYNDVKLSFKARENYSGIRVSDVTSFIVPDDTTEG